MHQYNLEKPDEDTMSAVNTHMSSTYEAPPVRSVMSSQPKTMKKNHEHTT